METNDNNQQQNSTSTQTPNVFDPSSLSPEAMRWVDQQRTQASQTARNNARKELMNDESFLKEVRNGMQSQVQQTVEEQIAQIRKEANLDRANAKVERILTQANISQEQIPTYLGMLVTENVEDSVARANDFISVFNKTVSDRIDAQTKSNMQSMTTPQSSGSTITDQERLQSAYDEAKKLPGSRRGVAISSVIREAQQLGVVLK